MLGTRPRRLEVLTAVLVPGLQRLAWAARSALLPECLPEFQQQLPLNHIPFRDKVDVFQSLL